MWPEGDVTQLKGQQGAPTPDLPHSPQVSHG